jgi:putative transposase
MKNTSLTEEQIVWALQQRDAGVSIHRICAHFGISLATFYNLRKRYGGLDVASVKQLRALETERFRLVKQIDVLKGDQKILEEILDHYIVSSNETRSCSRSVQAI